MDSSQTPLPTHLLPGITADSTLLFVHAHPDDETIVTGATMAAYAALGARVVLLTCSRGELGEVIPAELGYLEVGRAKRFPLEEPPAVPADGFGLGTVREHELGGALAALGVREHLWLGQGVSAPESGPTLFTDSGMQWGPDGRAMAAETVLEGALSAVPLEQLAQLCATVIRSIRPDALITYAADGGYGHPDHVRAHQMAMAAIRLAAVPGQNPPAWAVPHVFTIVSDRPERPLEAGSARIVVKGNLGAKTAAMRAHRTQITVDGERYALSDDVWNDITAAEEFIEIPSPALLDSHQVGE